MDPVTQISTEKAAFLTSEERDLFKEQLEGCFNKKTLRRSPFYLSLKDGHPHETDGSFQDERLVFLINSYMDWDKRNSLRKLFGDLQKGVYDHEFEIVDGMNGLSMEDEVRLDDLVPDLEAHTYDKEFLESVSQEKFNVMDAYFEDLLNSKKRFPHPRLRYASNVERLRRKLRQVNDQTNTLVSFGIQASEEHRERITEVGVSIYDPAKECVSLYPTLQTIHILIKENLHLRNGGFVDDNKDKFLSGDSIVLPQAQAKQLVQCLIDYYFITRAETKGMRGVFVGHNFPRMAKHLSTLGVEMPRTTTLVDTMKVLGITHGKSGLSSLGRVLRRFDIPHLHLSNAGNDAAYTLELLMKMADAQWRRSRDIDFVGEFREATKTKNDRNAREGDFFEGTVPAEASINKKESNTDTAPPIEFEDWKRAVGWVFHKPL